jgi:hypothetical protein
MAQQPRMMMMMTTMMMTMMMMIMMINVEQWWNENWKDKPKDADKTFPCATYSTTNTK